MDLTLEDDDPVIGDPGATIAIVEFADYECPFCQRFFQRTFPQIERAYIDTGKLKYVALDYPLGFLRGGKCSPCGNCAPQDAYLPMREQVVANIRNLHGEIYAELAGTAGLDGPGCAQCLADATARREIQADLAYARMLGVRGTPSFFIGRVDGERLADARRVVGAQGYAIFTNIIEGFLADG